jgi:hypothetical protein
MMFIRIRKHFFPVKSVWISLRQMPCFTMSVLNNSNWFKRIEQGIRSLWNLGNIEFVAGSLDSSNK